MNQRLSVWSTAPTTARLQRGDRYVDGSAEHPAKMLPALARHAITTYTKPGDLVLDPMCGIGTTLVEAVHLGRHALGTEYEPKWAHLAAANLRHADRQGATGGGEVFCGDARQLTAHVPAHFHGLVDLIVTSPPYGPSVHGQVRSSRESGERGVTKTHYRYSADRHNLAHVGLDALLEGFTEILTQCRHLLRPGGHIVITTRPWREQGELVDLPTGVLTAVENAGLIPVERNVALLAGIREGRLIARPSFFQMKNVGDARRAGIPLSLIAHEDTLVAVRASFPEASEKRRDENRSRRRATRPCRVRKPRTAATFRARACTAKARHAGH
ncbi:site-specific DNA-methyltransferase [Streptomyces sp. TRM66268-LWL]|uniref:Methyltransferase n=1 Tax=Streptomyces polyasparticus TaxID=2767826 RepID=A0ABR7SUU0_9ACTN|nr:DNA methyltransferase [Streptomyces polyasparticus]MBC9718043.1 site-specific DNA-methyltransferase [Streptomyces polyasparticus]